MYSLLSLYISHTFDRLWTNLVFGVDRLLGTHMKNTKSSFNARMPLAVTLIIAAFASAFFISTYSNKGEKYWVLSNSIVKGHVITPSDVRRVHMNLSSISGNYLRASEQVIGQVAIRSMVVDEVLSVSDVANAFGSYASSAVPLSLRSSDLATGVGIGDQVDIYWVFDSFNGEGVIDPIMILGSVTLVGLDDSKNSLGGDVSITVAIEETQVLRLLSATTQGRLVVVRSYV